MGDRKIDPAATPYDRGAKELPSIVSDEYFWMDILCIDQNDKDSRVAVTQYIPIIFRNAERTILIKEGGSAKMCCAKAVGEFSTREDFDERLFLHYLKTHSKEAWLEGVLSRL